MERNFLLSRRLAPAQRVPVAWPPPAALPLMCSPANSAFMSAVTPRWSNIVRVINNIPNLGQIKDSVPSARVRLPGYRNKRTFSPFSNLFE